MKKIVSLLLLSCLLTIAVCRAQSAAISDKEAMDLGQGEDCR